MKFTSKKDKYFGRLIAFSIGLILITFIWPLIIIDDIKMSDIVISVIICSLCIVLLLMTGYGVAYIFCDTHLFIKAGLFRSRIPYEKIIRISSTNGMLSGYRALSSKDALEISYHGGIMGSVIISPQNKEKFIDELKERAPQIEISL
ncbi:PH domain-containing protein [Saliterribacillus persicus]|uniref:PH (Pleckstrin Homology) domain-containing protein n=1 Tax=Saliterribacillus persicus TaxID=930114 RepID=A0A368X6N4_9BACI|nr:PH domain-containing protein [Saliterribacillus persicus]RCW62846.1 PH (Pleckstrin Homology) domain-containing protein [Saliterribacillus persicus]